jgi:phosphocarrier protein HPr
MASITVTVGSRVGLHARPASLFVQAAARQAVAVSIAKVDGEPVDARSILSVLGLDAHGGEQVVLSAEGEGADQALAELAGVVATDHDATQVTAPIAPAQAGP